MIHSFIIPHKHRPVHYSYVLTPLSGPLLVSLFLVYLIETGIVY
jgi:hypothetical protein